MKQLRKRAERYQATHGRGVQEAEAGHGRPDEGAGDPDGPSPGRRTRRPCRGTAPRRPPAGRCTPTPRPDRATSPGVPPSPSDRRHQPMSEQTEATESIAQLVASRLRDIPDFPEPGVSFKDFTPLLSDGAALRAVVRDIAGPPRGQHRRGRRHRGARLHHRRSRGLRAGHRLRAGAQGRQAAGGDAARRLRAGVRHRHHRGARRRARRRGRASWSWTTSWPPAAPPSRPATCSSGPAPRWSRSRRWPSSASSAAGTGSGRGRSTPWSPSDRTRHPGTARGPTTVVTP